MGFTTLKCWQYRNLENAELRFSAPRVFLVGENGQGKSNLLEAIYLLSFGSSFRTRKDQDLMLRGTDQTALHGKTEDHDVSIRFKGRSPLEKQIILDEKPIKDRKELVHTFPAIVFCHDDMAFVQGPPERRRWFFDQTMSLYEPLFIDTLRSYKKVLKLRNSALKTQAVDLLPVYDRQLADAGLEIQRRRELAVKEFNQVFSRLHGFVSGLEGDLEIVYRPSWKCAAETDAVSELLAERRAGDLELGTSGSGPHRDRFAFLLDGRDYTQIASTGQLRLLSLLLRVGQAQFFHGKSGREPVLLLDDVLLELDPLRRERFLSVLPKADQIFFTFLPDRQYLELKDPDTQVFQVQKGAFFPEV